MIAIHVNHLSEKLKHQRIQKCRELATAGRAKDLSMEGQKVGAE